MSNPLDDQAARDAERKLDAESFQRLLDAVEETAQAAIEEAQTVGEGTTVLADWSLGEKRFGAVRALACHLNLSPIAALWQKGEAGQLAADEYLLHLLSVLSHGLTNIMGKPVQIVVKRDERQDPTKPRIILPK